MFFATPTDEPKPGCAPSRDRRCPGVAAGSLGKVGHRPACDSAGTRTSRSRFRIADGGSGSDNSCWPSHGRLAGSLRGVRTRDPARMGARRSGSGMTERSAAGSIENSGSSRQPGPEALPYWNKQSRYRPPTANRPNIRPAHSEKCNLTLKISLAW